jgi:hypothetical protein
VEMWIRMTRDGLGVDPADVRGPGGKKGRISVNWGREEGWTSLGQVVEGQEVASGQLARPITCP